MTYFRDFPTSTTLIELCRKKDPNAWDRLTKLYKKLIFYWLKEYNVPAADSDDVYQDILLTLSKQFSSFRKGPTGKFRNWLRKIVFSRAMDYHNSKKGPKNESLKSGAKLVDSKATTEAIDKKLDAEKITDAQEQQENLILKRQLIIWLKNRCNPIHLDAFEMVLIKGMKSREVAEKLGLSAVNVRQIISRLRQLIERNWDGLL